MGKILPDGKYPCSVVVIVTDDKAEVIFKEGLKLAPGNELKLKNQPEGSAIRTKKDPTDPFNETALI